MIPLLNALFAPKPVAQPAMAAPQAGGALPWPTFPDGRTPLPYLPNGQPDFEAARTGVPSPGARFWGGAQAAAPARPGAYPGAPAAPAQPAAHPGAQPPGSPGQFPPPAQPGPYPAPPQGAPAQQFAPVQ